MFFTLAVLICGSNICMADPSVDEILRDAPLLDAPGPGYPGHIRNKMDVILYAPAEGHRVKPGIKMDLISEPDFGFAPKKKDSLKGDLDFKLTK